MTRDIESKDDNSGDSIKPHTWHLWGSAQEHRRTFAKGRTVFVAREQGTKDVMWYATDGTRVARRFNTLAAQKYLRTVRVSGKVVLATPAQAASADQTVEYIWYQLSR